MANIQQFKTGVKEIEEWLKKEMATIRTGRANPSILDGVIVPVYGSNMIISQVANIGVEGATTLRISPWDMAIVKDIEKSIMTSDLGLSVSVDDKGLRVTFPSLTSDRRQALVKIAKQKLEDAKVSVRSEREKFIKDVDKKEKDGELSKDENFRLKADLQKIVDEVNRVLEDLFTKKEKEISE